MHEIEIRHVEQGDSHVIISVVDHWWGDQSMTAMLPKLFFVHFIGVHPARRGEGLGRLLKDRVILTKDLQSCDAEHWA